jgi:putative transposase
MSNKEHKKHPIYSKIWRLAKNQVWATDITYIPMAKGFMYLTALICIQDLFWIERATQWVPIGADILQETIRMCAWNFNTDQGIQPVRFTPMYY